MYYPKAKVQENQYTSGGEFILSSGKSYKGMYHITFDGNFYTGATHTTDSQQLSKSGSPSLTPTNTTSGSVGITPSIITNFEYDTITNNAQAPLKGMVIPATFFPQPTDQDYAIGVIVRYFMKRTGGSVKNIKEISKDGFTDLSTNNLYTITSLQWKITGPLHDQVISQAYTVYGVFDTNSRTLSSKELGFPGISQYLADLVQFARII